MSKLKALLLTQGMHGMVSQVEGLAKALNLNYKHQEIKLKKFWNFIPPFFTPISTNCHLCRLYLSERMPFVKFN